MHVMPVVQAGEHTTVPHFGVLPTSHGVSEHCPSTHDELKQSLSSQQGEATAHCGEQRGGVHEPPTSIGETASAVPASL